MGTVLMIQFSLKMVSHRTVPIFEKSRALAALGIQQCIITMICFTAVITLLQEPQQPPLPQPQPQLQPQRPQRQPSWRRQQP